MTFASSINSRTRVGYSATHDADFKQRNSLFCILTTYRTRQTQHTTTAASTVLKQPDRTEHDTPSPTTTTTNMTILQRKKKTASKNLGIGQTTHTTIQPPASFDHDQAQEKLHLPGHRRFHDIVPSALRPVANIHRPGIANESNRDVMVADDARGIRNREGESLVERRPVRDRDGLNGIGEPDDPQHDKPSGSGPRSVVPEEIAARSDTDRISSAAAMRELGRVEDPARAVAVVFARLLVRVSGGGVIRRPSSSSCSSSEIVTNSVDRESDPSLALRKAEFARLRTGILGEEIVSLSGWLRLLTIVLSMAKRFPRCDPVYCIARSVCGAGMNAPAPAPAIASSCDRPAFTLPGTAEASPGSSSSSSLSTLRSESLMDASMMFLTCADRSNGMRPDARYISSTIAIWRVHQAAPRGQKSRFRHLSASTCLAANSMSTARGGSDEVRLTLSGETGECLDDF